MKRFKIIVVSMMFFLLIGCGKKSIPEVAIGYCYLNIYDDNIDIISPDGSLYKCNIGYQDDFDYDNGNIYYIGEDSFFKANISKQEVYVRS